MSKKNEQLVRIRRQPGNNAAGRVSFGSLRFACALGRSGLTCRKREGDGATPIGRLPVLQGFFRADRGRRPASRLALAPLRSADGWCDAVGDRNYNRPVRRPYPASHEAMWRDDGLYDIVVVLDWNVRQRVQRRGSAIFLHLARPGYRPTEGCIAISRRDMVRLLRRLRPGAVLAVG